MVINGDCLVELKKLPENSVDSVVTDPPYGLSFMGKKWDYDVPKVEIWIEVLRVLKPGGHLLSFAGSRTYHRMAVNIEDAGFEIRDQIMWVYGSGFPKSHNIGKAVDKLQGNERKDLGWQSTHINRPKTENWKKSAQPMNHGKFKVEGKQGGGLQHITKGNSPYEGWGTALKPAHEPIVVARKPLSEKTVAKNVLKWGTGGINIDGSRIKTKEHLGRPQAKNSARNPFSKGLKSNGYNDNSKLGRFPANLLHDGSPEVVSGFPNTGKSSGGRIGNKGSALNMMGQEYSKGDPGFGDSGSAARFFYCAKASKSERNKGLEGFEEKERVDYGGFHSEKGLIENNRNPENRKPTQNFHPTVKPIALMKYLVKLVTPPKGTVLDPFLGSGTTAIAAKLEGFDCIGIEMDKDYCKIAEARIKAWGNQLKMI